MGVISFWGVCCCFPIAYGGIIFIAALALRACVWAANRFMGTPTALKQVLTSYEGDEWLGYRNYKQSHKQKGIPSPGIGKSMVCIFLVNVASCLLAVPIWGLEDHIFDVHTHSGSEEQFLAFFLSLLIGFPLYASILANLFPCKFRQGCLVLFLYYVSLAVLAYVPIVIASIS